MNTDKIRTVILFAASSSKNPCPLAALAFPRRLSGHLQTRRYFIKEYFHRAPQRVRG
jgi:hypothetical protein